MNPRLRHAVQFLVFTVKVAAWAIVVLAFAFCGFVTWWNPYGEGKGNKEETAIQQIAQLEWACKAYMAKNGGTPPPSLDELVTPSGGKQPLLDGGSAALIDPWGKQFQYDPTHEDQDGHPDPVVMTTNAHGGPVYSRKRQAGR